MIHSRDRACWTQPKCCIDKDTCKPLATSLKNIGLKLCNKVLICDHIFSCATILQSHNTLVFGVEKVCNTLDLNQPMNYELCIRINFNPLPTYDPTSAGVIRARTLKELKVMIVACVGDEEGL